MPHDVTGSFAYSCGSRGYLHINTLHEERHDDFPPPQSRKALTIKKVISCREFRRQFWSLQLKLTMYIQYLQNISSVTNADKKCGFKKVVVSSWELHTKETGL